MEATKPSLHGVVPALVSCVDRNGEVDRHATRRQVNFVIEGGVGAIVALGGTGEFQGLSDEARIEVVETVIDAANGRVPVIAGICAPGLMDATACAKAFSGAGAQGVMLLSPYGVGASQAGIRDYYKAVSDKISQAVVLYEIPYLTGVTLTAQTIAAIVEDGSVFAYKASDPDMAKFIEVISLVGHKIDVLSGDEYLFPVHVALGAVGAILATPNIIPRTLVEIFARAASADLDGARKAHAKLIPFINDLSCEPNPGPLKEALAMVGMDVGFPVSPITPASDETKAKLKATVPSIFDAEKKLRRET